MPSIKAVFFCGMTLLSGVYAYPQLKASDQIINPIDFSPGPYDHLDVSPWASTPSELTDADFEGALSDEEMAAVPLSSYPPSVPAADLTMEEYLRRGTLKCETTTASPKLADIDVVQKWLEKRTNNNLCTVTNATGSKCNALATWGTAKISICGKWLRNVTCPHAAWAARHIANNCKWKGLAGGKWIEDPALYLAVH
ncbi:hypothetical protein EDC01DRAFT_776192 [Geopyxis carbonaria]|nr:hypothetical protein EDC01DRAFT_776192 [Geopyxis carbonaria]